MNYNRRGWILTSNPTQNIHFVGTNKINIDEMLSLRYENYYFTFPKLKNMLP